MKLDEIARSKMFINIPGSADVTIILFKDVDNFYPFVTAKEYEQEYLEGKSYFISLDNALRDFGEKVIDLVKQEGQI